MAMDPKALKSLAQLVRSQRVASLGSLRNGAPQVTLVAYAVDPEFRAFYLHLSGLARHTRAIEEEPQAALLISEPDGGTLDPQRLGRVSIQGAIRRLDPGDPELQLAQSLYLSRFPDAKRTISLGDFAFYRFGPTGGRYVAGFAQAFNIGPLDLSSAAASDTAS